MYSNIKSVQILVKLLKEFDIKDIVLSPGGSDIPVIHSIEIDDFFTCYSVVDERSAAYFAMGVAQEKKRVVACVCTSGTAVCNYLPGITEAFYQDVPVVAITCDKNPYYQGQLETQKIDQTKMFAGVVKKAVDLPLINNSEDEWLCNRLVNEALLAVNHHGTGPVQINIPIVGRTDIYDCNELPKQRVINRITPLEENWCGILRNKLSGYRKIMVVVGQNVVFDEEFKDILASFFDKYNCIYAVEHLSNLDCKGTVNTYPITEMCSVNSLLPELVISIGNNLAAYGLKPFLRERYENVENWNITEKGEVRDAYKCLTTIVECPPKMFFKTMIEGENVLQEHGYYDSWMSELAKVKMPELELSNLMVAEKLARRIPEKSVLHLAILNSTRIMQFFSLAKGVKTYSNVGALGIDGCMSTFAGQAASTDELAFLVIGDLSFFYDMNAAGLRSIGNNVRIILLNNGGGSEFHFFMGKDKIPSINDYICAEHNKVAAGWAISLGYEYYPVSSIEELDNVMSRIDQKTDKPVFVEVFTDMENEAIRTRAFYNDNYQQNGMKQSTVSKVIHTAFSDKQIDKVKKIIKVLKEK